MTYSESLHFTYAGKSSQDFGLINVKLESGFFEETFLPRRSIIEEDIPGRDYPYFFGFKNEPLEIPVSFCFEETWNDDKIQEIKIWLKQPKYEPLAFSSNWDKLFYSVVVEDSKIIHNGLKQGYLQLTFRCNSSYAYTPIYTSPIYDFSINTSSGTNLIFENKGIEICKPDIWIYKVDDGDVSIVNLSDGGREFKFTGLKDNEEIIVDNEQEDITTNLFQTYRYNNFNNKFLQFPRGVNYLKVYGNCKIQFKYRFTL